MIQDDSDFVFVNASGTIHEASRTAMMQTPLTTKAPTRSIIEQDPSTDDSRLAISIVRKQSDTPIGSEADDGRISQT